MECSVYASPMGEGRHRADPKTASFTDRTQRCDPTAVQIGPSVAPKINEYVAKVGPGTYNIQGGLAGTTTNSDWARAGLERDRVSGRQPIQPQVSFDLDQENQRGWNWNSVIGQQVKPKLSFSRAARYNRANMPRPETSPCATDFYDVQSAFDKLKRSEQITRGAASSFCSSTDRWKQKPGEASESLGDGPGAHGIPYDPNDSQAYFHRHGIDGKLSSSFFQTPKEEIAQRRLRQRKRESRSRHSAENTLSGPGAYWSKSMEDMYALCPKSTHSRRGSSCFATQGRTDSKLMKDVTRWRRDIPNSNFSLLRENRCWISTGPDGRLGSAGAMVRPRSGWSGSDRSSGSAFSNTSGRLTTISGSISRSRLMEAVQESERSFLRDSRTLSRLSRRRSALAR